jgi:hypothetical protein
MSRPLLIIGLGCAIAVGANAVAPSTRAEQVTAMSLLNACEAELRGDSVAGTGCYLYFLGYEDGFVATHRAFNEVFPKTTRALFCPIGRFNAEMMVRLFVNYGHQHPERMGTSWGAAVTEAMKATWPCKSGAAKSP